MKKISADKTHIDYTEANRETGTAHTFPIENIGMRNTTGIGSRAEIDRNLVINSAIGAVECDEQEELDRLTHGQLTFHEALGTVSD